MSEKKKIPELRFPEFVGEWESKKLGETVDVMQSGISRRLSDVDIGYPILRSNNIQNGELDITDIKYWYLKDNQGVNLKNYILHEGEILVNFINSIAQIGKVAVYKDLLKRDTIFTTNILRLSIKKSYSSLYIFYNFNTSKYLNYIQSITKPAVNQASFTTKDFNKYIIGVPSFDEQQKIASFFTAIDKKISLLKKKKSLLEQYKKGVMQKIFTQEIRFRDENGEEFPEWRNYKLGNICEIITGNKDTQNRDDSGSYPFFVRSQSIEKINSYSYDGEAILTSGDGVGVGKNFHYINGKFDFHQRVYCLRNFNHETKGKYLFYYFSKHFNKRVMRMSAKNSVDSVRREMVSDMKIPLPKIEEQTKIASLLTCIDSKINQTQTQIEKAELWKKGLLQKMFV